MADQRISEIAEIVGKVSGMIFRGCQTCLACEEFDENKEQCGLNGLRPPARVIAFGCECFIEKLPF